MSRTATVSNWEVLASGTFASQGTFTATVVVTDAGGSTVSDSNTTLTVVLFQDNFDRGPSSSLGPTWTDQTKTFAFGINSNDQATTSGTGVNLSTANNTSAINVSVQADVALSPGSSSVGLVARYGTTARKAHMYLGQIVLSHGTYTAVIDSVAGIAVTQLGSSGALTGFSGSGTLTFQVVGNALKLYVNGVLKVAVHSNAIATAGLVGMRGTHAALSNFVAASVPTQTTALPFSDSFTSANGQLSTVWTEQAGAFVVANQTATSFGTTMALATVNTATPSANVQLAAQVTVNPVGGASAGLIARYSGAPNTNEYVGQVRFSSTSHGESKYLVQIGLYKNGVFSVLGSQTVTVAGAFTGQLQFGVVGNSLKLFYGGVLEVAAHNSAISGAGLVGMRAVRGAISSFSAAAATTSTTTLPFSDSFTSANGQLSSVWTEQAGAFTVQNQTATPFGNTLALATLNTSAPVADANLQVGIIVNPTANAAAGLVARYSGTPDKNEYLGTIGYTRSSHGQNVYTAQIVVYRNGVRTVLASTTITVAGALTGTLAFDVVGKSLTLSLTSATGTQLLMLSKTDTRLTTGLVGMRGTGASFSDFSASSPRSTFGSLASVTGKGPPLFWITVPPSTTLRTFSAANASRKAFAAVSPGNRCGASRP